MRRGYVLLALGMTMTVPLMAACGSSSGNPGGTDGSTDGTHHDSGPKEGGTADAATVKAVATGQTVYVGQVATVNGASSVSPSGLPSFSWSVTRVPTGSMAASTLSGQTTATATIIPDLPGDYQLKLVITFGTATSSATADVTAVAPQAFYSQGSTTADGGLASSTGTGAISYYVIDSQGKNARAVTCPDIVPAESLGILGLLGGVAYDIWEGEAGSPPKFAGFVYEITDAAPQGQTRLLSGTSVSSCDAAPPTDLGVYEAGQVPFPAGFGPRFNADGSRIVFYDSSANVLTVAADGSTSARIIAPYFDGSHDAAIGVTLDPGVVIGTGVVPRAQWLPPNPSDASIGWARPTAGGWEIVTAPDIEGATPTNYMTCFGVTPREIAFLPNGNVLASYRASTGSPENLYQLDKACNPVQVYTNLSDSSNAVATDFSLSPDGKTIAFLSVDPAVQDAAPFVPTGVGGYLFVVPVDGSSTPTQVTTTPLIYGPRWIGGGSLLVATQTNGVADGGTLSTSVVVVSPDAGTATALATADGRTSTLSTSGNGACSIGSRAVGPGAFSLLSLVAVAHFARRRKRSRAR